MKTRAFLLPALFLAACCLAGPADAQTLTKKQIKKFKGEYIGFVTGIAGNTTAGTAPVTFETGVDYTAKSREFLVPQISNLHASPAHRIVYRKPTGNDRRIRVTGYYTGTAINPTTSLPEPVSGIRRMVITDRGKGKKVRFVMRFSDTLREGGYSAQDLKGTLGKEK
jgi:hypothetical protein